MIIGFTGTRLGAAPRQWRPFDRILARLVAEGAHGFVHGFCIGADTIASQKARDAGLHIIGRPGPYGELTGAAEYDEVMPPEPHLKRNQKIVDQSDVMLAIPAAGTDRMKGGTWYTIEFARKRNKPLYIIFPDGRVRAELMA